MTGGKINGTINIVRSTKGCLTCNLLAWGCQNLTTYNVTVIIVTWKLLSVGERQLPFFVSWEMAAPGVRMSFS